VDDKRLAANPMRAKSVRWPRAEQERREAWPLETALRVRDVIRPRNRIAVVLGLGCGLRQGEVFGLSPEDIDYGRGVLRVRRQVQAIKGRPKYSLLLTTRYGDAIAVNTWNTYTWKPALAKAGVIQPPAEGAKQWQWEAAPQDGFHVLRHTFASITLEAGESVVTVARWPGHSSPAITLGYYAHFMPEAGSKGRTAVDGLPGRTGSSMPSRTPQSLPTADPGRPRPRNSPGGGRGM
jgi:integrase